MCGEIYGRFARTRMYPIARQVLTRDSREKEAKNDNAILLLFAYRNARRRESIVVGRGDLAWPKLRTASSVSRRDRETRVSPTVRRRRGGKVTG